MDLSNLKRDSAKIEGGEWIGDIPNAGDLKLHVRGMSSKVYQSTMARLGRSVPREKRQQDGSLTTEAALEVMAKAIASCVLLNWSGIESNGKPIEYSKEQAEAWLTDPDYKPFLEAVIYAASVVDYGRKAATEALEKN